MTDDLDRCDPNKPILLPEAKPRKDGPDDLDDWYAVGKPAWSRIQNSNGKVLKPLIRCKCGQWSGIGLHHVHADGNVTASYFHATAEQLKGMGEAGKRFTPGCGWHVYIKLQGYDCGDFPPNTGQ